MNYVGASILTVAIAAALLVPACSGDGNSSGTTGGPGGPAPLSADELQDPEKCSTCHPDHFREWSGSMHAYAADDPVFLAMNARAQRETKGQIGSFCVRCHAPMALRTGATKDGLNLASVPQKLKGVTCYFCHSVAEVKGSHSAPLELADDGIVRGGIHDPTPTRAHRAGYSPLLDRERPESASLCGSCHDIVTPLGAHVERTFAEWKGTLFSHEKTQLTCSQCHMDGRRGLAADAPGVTLRRVHAHTFPGVDVALTDFPEMKAQREAVQASLDTTLQAELCVKGAGSPGATLQVVLDNVGAGHLFPSGATQDRRAWVEVVAYAEGKVIYQSGVVPDGASVKALSDPDLWLIRDCNFDAKGAETHLFWQAASYDSNQLPGPTTNVPTDPAYYATHVVRNYPRPTSTPSSLPVSPDRVTLRVRIIPVGLDILDDLIQSGDLDASVKSKMPVFTLKGTELEWTKERATFKYPDQGIEVTCVASGSPRGAKLATVAPEHQKCKP